MRRGGFLNFCESARRIGFWTYTPIVRKSDRPVISNRTGKKTSLSAIAAGASLDMLKLLPGRLLERCSGEAGLSELHYEALNNTK